ncbi:Uma2 family endonuclease [Pendulispora brunnea]|uniref:Uma2 family endonuclease n=1 Tax=Pendulispora brunnea TaxID=2905690 RepID=A0ABZ2K8W7_9BACT
MAQPAVTIQPSPKRPMTIEEWADMPEDEPGELVDGYLEEEEAPDFIHEAIVSWLFRVLANWLVPRGGRVFGSDAKYRLTERRGRKPDLAAYLPGSQLPGGRRAATRVPPDIAVEVVSPAARDRRRDRVEKTTEYAQFGVRYYWLIDPEARTLEILELGTDGRYVLALTAADGAVSSVPGCPELSLDLDALWADIDSLPQDEDEPAP